MSNPLPTYTPREYLSISTLMKFVRCPRLYFFTKSGLTPREVANRPLYGQAMHKAVPTGITEGLEPALRDFSSVWDETFADDARSLRRATQQLSHFIHTHKPGNSLYTFEPPPPLPVGVIKSDESTNLHEIPFVVDVGLPIPLTGRIDGLVKHRDSGELWGWEFKTASTRSYGARLFEGMEMHPQTLAYILVLQTMTGKKVKGVMVEAMLVDARRVDNMIQPILVQDHLVEGIHTWLHYWGKQLLACEELAKDMVSKGASWAESAKAFVQNFAMCTAYPNFYIPSFPCDFQNLCRVRDFEGLVSMYDIKEDHKFVNLTTERG